MKKSFLGSVSFHAAVVLAALFGIPATKPFEIQPVEAIQVDISKISDTTKVKAQTKSNEKPAEKPKPKAAKVPDKVKPQEKVAEEKKVAAKEPEKQEPTPPKPEKKIEKPIEKPVEKKVEDKPVDADPLKQMLEAEEAELKLAEEQKKKDETKKKKEEAKKKKAEEDKLKQEEEAAEKAEADAKAKADAKKKLEAEKMAKKLDVAQLEELLNKENTESASTLEKKDEAGTPEKAEKDTQGSDAEAKATFRDALQAKVLECFSPPPASKEAGIQIVVPIDFTLAPDGSIKGRPKFNLTGDSIHDSVGIAAISAIMECQPYNFFQDGKYKGFARWILDFNPQDAR